MDPACLPLLGQRLRPVLHGPVPVSSALGSLLCLTSSVLPGCCVSASEPWSALVPSCLLLLPSDTPRGWGWGQSPCLGFPVQRGSSRALAITPLPLLRCVSPPHCGAGVQVTDSRGALLVWSWSWGLSTHHPKLLSRLNGNTHGQGSRQAPRAWADAPWSAFCSVSFFYSFFLISCVLSATSITVTI